MNVDRGRDGGEPSEFVNAALEPLISRHGESIQRPGRMDLRISELVLKILWIAAGNTVRLGGRGVRGMDASTARVFWVAAVLFLSLSCPQVLSASIVKPQGPNESIMSLPINDIIHHQQNENYEHSNTRAVLQSSGAGTLRERILGGEDAPIDRYNYAVSLRTKGVNAHFCSGVLIEPQWVLTAAHCVDRSDGQGVESPLLIIGDFDISTANNNEQVQRTVETIIHPSWSGNVKNGSDIALLLVDQPSPNVPTPLLGNDSLQLGNQMVLTVIGWSKEGRGGRHNILQHGDLELVSNEMCQRVFPDVVIRDEMMCAGGRDVDSCDGDSGGPLIVANAPNDLVNSGEPAKDWLVGIVSFGQDPCGQEGLPGVYTRLSSFWGWIKDTTTQALRDQDSSTEEGADEQDPDVKLLAVAAARPNNSTKGEIEDLLSMGASPDACCNRFGGPALHETSESDNAIAAKALIENDADVNKKDAFGLSPLHYAALKNAPKVAQVLIDAGADVNAADANLETPLHLASKWGAVEMAELLVKAGANQSATNLEGRTASEIICSSSCDKDGAEEDLESLLVTFPEPSVQHRTSPVENSEQQRLDQELLQLAESGETASTEISVTRLLSEGASPDACCNALGGTALHQAALFDNALIAVAVIRQGANVNAKDGLGRSPLHVAALSGSRRVGNILISADADVNAKNGFGGSALHEAARSGQALMAEELIAAMANTSARDDFGNTPLHIVARWGHTEVAKVLFAAGVDVNARNDINDTPLHDAARWGQVGMAELLLEAQSDKFAKNGDGKAPKDVICSEFCNKDTDHDNLKRILA